MRILNAFRRMAGGDSTADASGTDGGESTPSEHTEQPFEGYDKLDPREISEQLSGHSQVELEAVEGYERSHENREVVLDKLRYMRTEEPLLGYDALSTEEIQALLEKADMKTIKAIRAYERKFAKRPDVLEAVVSAYETRRDAEPPREVPAYQSASATAATNGNVVPAPAKDPAKDQQT